jgi:hypothetical protein
MKTGFERSVEMMTWAAVFIWIGLVLIMQLWSYPWVVFLVLGIVLLSSALYQRARGWDTSLFIWISGIWMAVFSVMEVVREMVGAVSGEAWSISWVVYAGITLISLGIAVVFRGVSFGGHEDSLDRYSNPASSARRRSTSTRREPQIPRQITTDDRSTGWASPDDDYPPRTSSSRSSSRNQSLPEDDYPPRASSSRTSSRNQYPPEDDYPPRTSSSRTSSRTQQPVERPRQSAPAEDPNDLEQRVEDIIRRSREKRDRGNIKY